MILSGNLSCLQYLKRLGFELLSSSMSIDLRRMWSIVLSLHVSMRFLFAFIMNIDHLDLDLARQPHFKSKIILRLELFTHPSTISSHDEFSWASRVQYQVQYQFFLTLWSRAREEVLFWLMALLFWEVNVMI